MRNILVFISLITSLSTFADIKSPYEQASDLYAEGGTPERVSERSLWAGFCSDIDSPNRVSESVFTLHREEDPILGDRYYLYALFGKKYVKEVSVSDMHEEFRVIFSDAGFRDWTDVLYEDTARRAWVVEQKTLEEVSAGVKEKVDRYSYFFRQNRTEEGALFFTLRMVDKWKVKGQFRHCYYFVDRSYKP